MPAWRADATGSGYTDWKLVSGSDDASNIGDGKYVKIDGANISGSGTQSDPFVVQTQDSNTTYSTATSSTLGLVKIGYTESGKNYPVELSSGKMYVNVPWTDANTTYSVGDNGLTAKNFTSTLKTKLDGIETGATADQTAAQIKSAALSIYDARAAEVMPSSYPAHKLALEFSDEFGSLGSWYSAITMKGWDGNYAAWQLIGNADNNSTDDNLYFRQGSASTWNTMRKVYHDGNLSGGTNVSISSSGVISSTDTDTVYTHPTSAGNKHIPTGGAAGQFLKYSASGTAVWAAPSYTTNTDTQLSDSYVIGLFSGGTNVTLASDGTISSVNTTYSVGDNGLTAKNFTADLKTKLDGIAAGATTDQTLPTLSSLGGLSTTAKAADSNLLDGLDLHTGRNNEVNKVVRTDANGYIQAGWINSTSGNNGTTSINRIYASQDGYIRYYTPANFISVLGLSESSHTHVPGDVGLGNLSSSGNALAGAFTATGDITAFSDARVKENVETIPNALEKVTALRGVNFNKVGDEKRSTGVIAQEVKEVLPEVIHENEDGMLSVAYGNITGVLIEAIKEQQKQIDELKAKLDGLTK